MDKTIKFLLGLIAVGLIGINVQMWNGKTGLIKPAFAKFSDSAIRFNVCYQGDESLSFRQVDDLDAYDEKWGRCN